jgi:hypothetical protein
MTVHYTRKYIQYCSSDRTEWLGTPLPNFSGILIRVWRSRPWPVVSADVRTHWSCHCDIEAEFCLVYFKDVLKTPFTIGAIYNAKIRTCAVQSLYYTWVNNGHCITHGLIMVIVLHMG